MLHLDRNDYYGGEGASLNFSQLWTRFRPSVPVPTNYGKDREYCIDLVPKFLMASGEFVDILANLDLSRYIDFVQVDGSFVYREGKGVCKVPSTPMEAASSSLMGFFEKRRARDFFQFCASVKVDNPATWHGHNLQTKSANDLFRSFSLESNTIDFIGHALALFSNDNYLQEPAASVIIRAQLYMNSMLRFGRSPYLYPLYGLGELPQGFARLSAIYGGTYMLNMAFDGFVKDGGVVSGVSSGGSVFTADRIICDPSYAPDRVQLSHRVIRAICLLNHQIPTTNSESCQIIIPQKQLQRHHDVYVSCVSSAHNACPAGFYLAQVSTIVETANPEQEIQPALRLLGPVLEKFLSISNLYEPASYSAPVDNLFVTRSLDDSTHFESVCEDVKRIYQQIFNRALQLRARPTADEEQRLFDPGATAMASAPGIQDV